MCTRAQAATHLLHRGRRRATAVGGAVVGALVGALVGSVLGALVGRSVGSLLGARVGGRVGALVPSTCMKAKGEPGPTVGRGVAPS